MLTIGLIGGIASGKSAVAAALAKRGAVIYDADRIGHSVLQRPAVRDELVARRGAGILDGAGGLSRPAIAKLVFGDTPAAKANRQHLEELLHPLIRAQIEAEIRQLPDTDVPAVVIDAPLLLESGWNEVCQAVAFVDTPREQRLTRAEQNRGWSAEEFARREASQMPIEQKKGWSTHIIRNDGSLSELDAEVDRFWSAVRRR
ncbi:dephospho-CoA kinase [Lacipirellula sp.]|uniref:dephospho-CoA kinase n=1 Tax=Lacipirellula sp. TaxID=2691419 RepID=UPI003D0B4373